MNSVPEQLLLPVMLREGATFSTFYPGANALPVHSVRQLLDGTGEWFIFLAGARGSGKSHLLQAACHEMVHRTGAAYLPLEDLLDVPPSAMLEGVEQAPLVCIDDLQLIAGNPEWEEALFHAFNRIKDAQVPLLVAATLPPSGLGIRLQDLASRLSWGTVFHLELPEDGDKLEILRLQALSRGMELSDEVLQFLIARGSRELVDMLALLERLDHASLAQKRRISVPFVKKITGW